MKHLRSIPCHRGFTLIELLVVMTVLSMFLMMTTIVTRDALDMHAATRARLVSERNAAAFMRQFDSDIFQRVNRDDTPVRFKQEEGNDEIALVTKRQGYAIRGSTSERRASLVSYRIKQNMMERAASGYGFGSSQDRPAEDLGTLALKEIPAEGPKDPDAKAFQVIAPAIIRLEFSFIVREENVREGNTSTRAIKHVLRAKPPEDTNQIVAVIATIATLDPDRSGMLNETKLGVIAKRFPDAVDNELPLNKWAEIAANLTRQMPDMPRPALQQVRVHQGVFTLTSRIPLP